MSLLLAACLRLAAACHSLPQAVQPGALLGVLLGNESLLTRRRAGDILSRGVWRGCQPRRADAPADARQAPDAPPRAEEELVSPAVLPGASLTWCTRA